MYCNAIQTVIDEGNPRGRCFSVIRGFVGVVHPEGSGLYCTGHYAVLTWGIVIGMLRSMTPCLWLFAELTIFVILTVKILVLWYLIPGRQEYRYHSFGGTSCFHCQVDVRRGDCRTYGRHYKVACYRAGFSRSWETTVSGTVGPDICGPSLSDFFYVPCLAFKIRGGAVGVCGPG